MARNDSLQGTLPLLVLTILERRGPLHGYGITEHIEGLSDVLRVEEGSLYPALHRMEEAGWIKARWVVTDRNRRARQYEITIAGPPPARRRGEPMAHDDRCGRPCAEACVMSWLSRLVNVFRSGRLDDDLEDELRFHLEEKTRD